MCIISLVVKYTAIFLDAYLMNLYRNVLTLRQQRLRLFEVCIDFLLSCISVMFLERPARVSGRMQIWIFNISDWVSHWVC